MGDVIKLRPEADPDEVLTQALGRYDQVVIFGWNKHGDFEVEGVMMDPPEIIYMLRMMEHAILAEALE